MNYLTEILAFFRWLQANHLGPLLQACWHLLMYTNNSAAVLSDDGQWYWPLRFKIANRRVWEALDLQNRFQVAHARTHLIRHGRLRYHPHGGNKAGEYELIPFDQGLCPLWITQAETGKRTQVWAPPRTEAARTAAPLINGLNHQIASLLYCNQEDAPDFHDASLLSRVTESEEAAINALFPNDAEAASEAMRQAQARKVKVKKVEG